MCVCVCVCACVCVFVYSLANHLGANPEKCEPGCVVTQATRGGFFILEVSAMHQTRKFLVIKLGGAYNDVICCTHSPHTYLHRRVICGLVSGRGL